MNRLLFVAFLLLNASILNISAAGVSGVDVSTAVTEAQFSCLMKTANVTFAVVRAWESLGDIDPNAVNTINAAIAAGYDHVDAYLFPCYSCSIAPELQVDKTLANLTDTKFTSLWFDVETGGGNGDPTANIQWLQRAVNRAVQRLGAERVGIYASDYEWNLVMGNYNGFPNLRLWYAHYDKTPSFQDFTPFAGWRFPWAKQYQGTHNVCGAGIDSNWKPS
jgi:GH25 family lysozyme M1 (1,4-beta-N-acetylmuramidase)